MSKHDKFLVTVDSDSRQIVRVEQMGEAGELVEVPSSALGHAGSTLAAPAAATPRYAINIYMGSDAPSKVATHGLTEDATQDPPMVIPSPGVIPSAGSLRTASTEEEAQS